MRDTWEGKFFMFFRETLIFIYKIVTWLVMPVQSSFLFCDRILTRTVVAVWMTNQASHLGTQKKKLISIFGLPRRLVRLYSYAPTHPQRKLDHACEV